MNFKKIIGTKKFYKSLLMLAVPIMIQNGITNFVNMLDNLMIGQVGTMQMTGVAITNQLLMVFNLCIFGAVSGAGIFGAQFFGKGDHIGLRNTFRFKAISALVLSLIGAGIFLLLGNALIGLYLKGEGSAADAAAALRYAKEYLFIMLLGLLPFSLVQCYSGTLRETGRSVFPMIAGIAAVLINLALNYALIFGHFGAPALGVRGAAIATVISRFAELLLVALRTHLQPRENPFIKGVYRSMKIPLSLAKQIILRGLPLMLNEMFWAAGIATLSQCYSVRGLDVVAANNINQTFFNVFSVTFISVGVAVGILLGQIMGSGRTGEAMDTAMKAIAFSALSSIFISILYFFLAPLIPRLYNTTEEVRATAAVLMQITAVSMMLDAFAHACYFTLRSGGKMLLTVLFDSCFLWILSIPVAAALVYGTSLSLYWIYGICQGLNILKCVLGYIFVKKGTWIKNLVEHTEGEHYVEENV